MTRTMGSNPPATKLRILVVDDHPIVRQGLALMIDQEPDLEVCGEAEAADQALRALTRLQPDILVLDLSLPGNDGIGLLKTIRAAHPSLPILILSMHDESVYAERALRAGANGYIMKQEATERVLVALRRILKGEVYLSDRLADRMLRRAVGQPNPSRRPSRPELASLTDRELEVFELIGRGLGTREIARELELSVKTVESYQAHIKEKLSLPSARALMQRAIEWRVRERAV